MSRPVVPSLIIAALSLACHARPRLMDDCPHRADARLVAPVPIALALKTVAGACAGRLRHCQVQGRRLVRATGAAWLTARTIDAAALGTGAAPVYDSFAQRRTSTEDAHARIVRGNPGFGGVVLHRDAVHIDATKRQRVLRLQGLGEACHAPTDSVALIEVRFDVLVELPRKHRECAVARASPSVMIDHCIALDTVEPCHGGFLALEPQL